MQHDIIEEAFWVFTSKLETKRRTAERHAMALLRSAGCDRVEARAYFETWEEHARAAS